jgi:uncharacterized protein
MLKCPKCANALTVSNRQGIEIDSCPQCRGIWLDRGELEKIIEREHLEIIYKLNEEATEKRDKLYSNDTPIFGQYEDFINRKKQRKSFFDHLFNS